MDTLPKTASEIFLHKQRSTWLELKRVLDMCKFSRKRTRGSSTGSRTALSAHDLRQLPVLYRAVCTDLAEARMRRLAPDVLAYLNDLLVAAHNEIYGYQRLRRRPLHHLVSVTLPDAVRGAWRTIATAAVLFVVPLVVSWVVVLAEPVTAGFLLDETTLGVVEEMYSAPSQGLAGRGARAAGTAFYIQHNVSIAFLCFATGALAGLGSIYFLVYNGLFLGTISGYVVAVGFGHNLFRFVTAHAAFELVGLIIAGAAGLRLGSIILRAGAFRRPIELANSRNSILALLATAIVLISAAAIIEATVSPSGASQVTRLFVAGISVALITFASIRLLRRGQARRRNPS